jgi:hypothetical protein
MKPDRYTANSLFAEEIPCSAKNISLFRAEHGIDIRP